MTLQAKATLGSVMLATIMVTLVSSVDLGSYMDLGLQATFERSDFIKDVARDAVIDALNRRRDVALREALSDPELKRKLLSLLRSPNGVLSIDMVSAENQEVLASTLESRIGSKASDPDFGRLVRERSWFEKLNVLLYEHRRYFMLQDPVGSSGATLLYVRVVIYPALIRPSLKDTLQQKTEVAVISVGGAVLLTFLFSMAVFRSLGHLGQMLDQAASGQYEVDVLPSEKAATDELSNHVVNHVDVVASRFTAMEERVTGLDRFAQEIPAQIEGIVARLDGQTETLRHLEQRQTQRVSTLNQVLDSLARLKEPEPAELGLPAVA